MVAENKLADMSTEFAIQILKLTDGIKGHYSLSNQLERSGTSIGANIREAKYAHSRPEVEIVPSDSSWTLIISKDDTIIDSYIKMYPKSEDLSAFNQR